MGDSDDEYDRKRRDKFRGERTESYSRESRRGSSGDGRRDDWSERLVKRLQLVSISLPNLLMYLGSSST